MVNSTLVTTIYVNPIIGDDNHRGSHLKPYKSISQALAKQAAPMIIQLVPGIYSIDSGERFPLIIPQDVIIVGHEMTKGKDIIITGSGNYKSPLFGKQSITVLIQENGQLIGVTVTNNGVKGSAIWIESANAIVCNNTLRECGREAIFICGHAKPLITDNVFVKNANSGIVLTGHGKGEILRNVLEDSALGIAISGFAAPLIIDNKLSTNQISMVVSGNSCPVLRRNFMTANSQGGLFVSARGVPDLGNSQDPASNIFHQNQDFDIQNLTTRRIFSAGNQLNPSLIKGLVEIVIVAINKKNIAITNTSFSDIGEHWARDFIEALVSRGLVNGFPDGTFRPDLPMSRAQYAAIITKIFQPPKINFTSNFTDISPDFWANQAIAQATSMGFLYGFPDGSFRPRQNLTRIQAIISIVNGLKLSGGNTKVLLACSDRAQIPSYATSAVAIATQKMLISNYPDTSKLELLRDIKRGELAALVYQALVLEGKQKPIPSPYIVRPEEIEISSFSDLTGHWAEPFIRRLTSMNLTRGFIDGTYQPDKPMNRAQYADLIAVTFNPKPKRKVVDFSDVPKPFWAYSAIQMAVQGGFISGSYCTNPQGYNHCIFRPHAPLQRLQVLVSLADGLLLPIAHPDVMFCYTDYSKIPKYAQAAVAAATVKKIAVSFPNPKLLQPNKVATRAEVVAMVYQALVAIGRLQPINSNYIISTLNY